MLHFPWGPIQEQAFQVRASLLGFVSATALAALFSHLLGFISAGALVALSRHLLGSVFASCCSCTSGTASCT